MTEEATQQGVSRQEQDREALIAKRAQERAKEAGEIEATPEPGADETDEIETDSGAEDEVSPDPEPQPEPVMMQFIDDQGNVYEVPASAAAKLKIDGEEVETPLETALRRYQKGAAGDKRLQEASNIQRELEAKTQDLTRREQQLLEQMQQAEAKNNQGNLSDDDYAKKISDLAAALAEADEERAAELFRDVLPKGQQQKAPDPVDIDARVSKKFEEYQKQNDLKKAQSEFYDNYSDLAEDPMLFEMVDSKTAKIAQENPQKLPSEIIRQAAEEVKQWRDEHFKTAASKRKKKSSPTPVSGRAKIGEDEPAPLTREQVLDNMRAARGQPARY